MHDRRPASWAATHGLVDLPLLSPRPAPRLPLHGYRLEAPKQRHEHSRLGPDRRAGTRRVRRHRHQLPRVTREPSGERLGTQQNVPCRRSRRRPFHRCVPAATIGCGQERSTPCPTVPARSHAFPMINRRSARLRDPCRSPSGCHPSSTIGQHLCEFTHPLPSFSFGAGPLVGVPRGPLMTTIQVPRSFTHVLRRRQRHPRQPFYELVMAACGLLASPGRDEPP